MESVDPDATANTIPQPNNASTTSDVRKWFETEAAVSNGEVDVEDKCSEDEDDLYNDALAAELLLCNSIAKTNNEKSNEPLIDSTTEGLGTIFAPYRNIIYDCIRSVFNINTPKEWQTLLIQSLVFSDHATTDRIMCIRQTGDGKSLVIQCTATMQRYVSIVVVPLIS